MPANGNVANGGHGIRNREASKTPIADTQDVRQIVRHHQRAAENFDRAGAARRFADAEFAVHLQQPAIHADTTVRERELRARRFAHVNIRRIHDAIIDGHRGEVRSADPGDDGDVGGQRSFPRDDRTAVEPNVAGPDVEVDEPPRHDERGVGHDDQAASRDGCRLIRNHQGAVRRQIGNEQRVGRSGWRPDVQGVDEQIDRRCQPIDGDGLRGAVGDVNAARDQRRGRGAGPIRRILPKPIGRGAPDRSRRRGERKREARQQESAA